jgi:hypothetical protein
MKKNSQSNSWVYVAGVGVVLLVIAEGVSSRLINDSSVPSSVDGPFAGLVSLGAVATFIICSVALFKAKKWLKVVPIIGILVSLIIFGLAFFAYSFSGYGSPS